MNFSNNYEPSEKGWGFMVLFSRSNKGAYEKAEVKIPAISANGIIEGHRQAFKIARYGYEKPKGQKLKSILYNIEGLQFLSWLMRGLAHHTVKEVQAIKKTSKGSGRQTATVSFPTGPIKRFPKKNN